MTEAKAAAEKYVCVPHPYAHDLRDAFLAGWEAGAAEGFARGIEEAAKVALRLERSMTCPKTPSHALVQCADEIRKLAE